MAKVFRWSNTISMTALNVLLLAALMCLSSILLWQHNSFQQVITTAQSSNDAIMKLSRHPPHSVALRAGDLPGYTGWTRPSETCAGHYRILSMFPSATVEVNTEWKVVVACNGPTVPTVCTLHQAYFYVRAYGPSVITGRVRKMESRPGSYEIIFVPPDEGQYTVEIVLTFSSVPSFEAFPLRKGVEEPAYEGYLLPEFPLQLTVTDRDKDRASRAKPTCSLQDLQVQNALEGHEKARWRVIDRVNSATSRKRGKGSVAEYSWRAYQDLETSMGIHMKYEFLACSLSPLSKILKVFSSYRKKKRRSIHVVFIGDSVMRMQEEFFRFNTRGVEGVRSTIISTSGGILATRGNVTESLHAIEQENPLEKRFILFNIGLHEVYTHCNTRIHFRELHPELDSDEPCLPGFRTRMADLVKLIESVPAELRSFQITTAAWPKYGNFGFAWPTVVSQPFTFSPNFISHLNDIAVDVVVSESDSIALMDGYWITLARPDNRESTIDNRIGPHLVHPGREVAAAMVHTWMNMVARRMERSLQ